jgi:hypothetical protein
METWSTHIKKNQCLIAILHLFSIETTYKPCLTLTSNQTKINFDR